MVLEKDLQIIRELRKNARTSLKELALKLQLPPSTVHDKVNRYHGKIIKKHTSLLNFQELGYQTHLFLALKTKKEFRGKLELFLKYSQEVNSFYQVNENYDYLVEAVFTNQKKAYDFIEEIKERFLLEKIQIHNIISNPKKEEFLASPKFL